MALCIITVKTVMAKKSSKRKLSKW